MKQSEIVAISCVHVDASPDQPPEQVFICFEDVPQQVKQAGVLFASCELFGRSTPVELEFFQVEKT